MKCGADRRPVSFTDLNGGGKPDLMLRNHLSGLTIVLYQDGVTVIGAAVLPTLSDVVGGCRAR